MKTNEIVAVTFLDHVESPDGAKAMKFTVYGRLVLTTAQALVVASWAHASNRRRCDHNTTTFTILRSAIQKVDVLTIDREKTIRQK